MIFDKVLEERESKINSRIKVVRSLGFGTYIQVDNLTQSGGIIEDIWKPVLSKVHSTQDTVHRALILGLGGGTVAKLIHKTWPEAKITGIDIDPIMVEMGKKYLGLDKIPIDIQIKDASDFGSGYDLVIVDLYVGREFPAKFTSEAFLKELAKNKLVIFNRLYFGEKRPEAVKFGNKLQKFFTKVDFVYPQANLLLVCSVNN